MEKSSKKKTSDKEIRKGFGYHLALDLYNCDPKEIRDTENCYHLLAYLPNIIKTAVQSPPFVIRKKDIGFCGWIPVVESGISLYVYFPTNFVAADIYTCKKFDYKKIKRFVASVFKPKETREYYFLRGEEYIHPTKLLKARGLL
jgi:S-adenosylmethionine/arginine decarboxylase-like enzyme